MLSYDRTLLDNDKFSEILLRRLNHNHSPSFHDFAHAPPKTILDLGCGSGGWAVEAAEFWPSSQVIGFDLLDPARLRSGAEAPSNVQWKQGNFVKYKLPFPKNMFDLVRMANLSLCIPQERWEHVMSEARRVLAQGGRLELIDDYMFFPYTKRPPQSSPDSHDIPRLRPSSSSFDDDDDGIKEDTDFEQPDGDDADDDDDDDFVSTKSRFSSVVDTDDFPPQPAYDPVAEWNQNADNSKSLEQIFEDMLSRKFSINPRPSKFLDNIIDKVFGRYNQCRLHEFNLYLAPPSSPDSDDSSIGSSETQGSAPLKKAGKDFAKWMTTVDWDHHKEKKPRAKGDRSSEEGSPSFSVVPETISPKAAGRLGIKPAPQPSHPHTPQSPGLVLWPATFIPIPPFELEMHACKHLHSLIGCKAALTEHLQDVARERHLFLDQQMVDDLIWDYESFRRKRFNWPSDYPDSHLEDEVPVPLAPTPTPRSNTFRNSYETPHPSRPRNGSGGMGAPPDPLFPRDKLDLVRCIRVYSATKLDEEIHVS
jgi:SAM-dependent methyltransferase